MNRILAAVVLLPLAAVTTRLLAGAQRRVAEAWLGDGGRDRIDRIVLAEDLLLLREGITHILRSEGHEVVAAVGDAHALLAAVVEHRPDVTIADVRPPPGFRDEGLRAAIRLRAERPGEPVLILSQYMESSYAADLLSDGLGGVGYLLKDRIGALDDFLDALHRVAAGGSAMDPEVVAQLINRNWRDIDIRRRPHRQWELRPMAGSLIAPLARPSRRRRILSACASCSALPRSRNSAITSSSAAVKRCSSTTPASPTGP